MSEDQYKYEVKENYDIYIIKFSKNVSNIKDDIIMTIKDRNPNDKVIGLQGDFGHSTYLEVIKL